MQLRILTLNIWGVHFVSKLINERIQALIEHLTNVHTNYDIIGLQEVWSKKDYVYIRDQLKTLYPYSYYFLSGLIGSGCCIFSKHPIIAVYQHQYTLNGFPHKIQHGDWFCGKLIGLCKIFVNGYIINVYNTHLHANYHHVIEKDSYFGHRLCQAYELIQFIESTSLNNQAHLTILMGDLNLAENDLAIKLIKGILKINDSLLHRINMDIFDPAVGNIGETTNVVDNPYVQSHPYRDPGYRVDYIFYRSKYDNVKCIESYLTLDKVPNSSKGLRYSDHYAIYALLDIDEKFSEAHSKESKQVEILDEETRQDLEAACIIVEESIQRIQRHRLYCLIGVFFLFLILFSDNGKLLSNSYLFAMFIIIKNIICLIALALCLWFISFGKPVERNALKSIQNAMRLRLNPLKSQY